MSLVRVFLILSLSVSLFSLFQFLFFSFSISFSVLERKEREREEMDKKRWARMICNPFTHDLRFVCFLLTPSLIFLYSLPLSLSSSRTLGLSKSIWSLLSQPKQAIFLHFLFLLLSPSFFLFFSLPLSSLSLLFFSPFSLNGRMMKELVLKEKTSQPSKYSH